ncbi:dermonecrotic toxin domain-containing protein [Pseudomonas sp. UFMG81]|uniref:dermonecrotic toxin domain-containing protein n=1 Tax=Pseudomonas sp. UFMG81 TaxID=2745936 RepID=UPI00188FAED1|nr:DUF6543 domain-containing protein [Pseudomonas sp. UFMG81]
MDIPVAPYHHQQILDALPAWTRQLHPRHIGKVIRRAHQEHIKPDRHEAAWFSSASHDDRQLLRSAIHARTVSRKAFAKAIGDLQQLPQFCESLLQQTLAISTAVGTAQYCFQPFETIQTGNLDHVPDLENYGLGAGTSQPEWTYQATGEPTLRSLLEAAMHNFEGVSEVGPFSRLQASATDGAAVPGLSVTRFVTQCRALDLGKRYQAHLDGIFAGERKATVSTAWIAARRAELTVQAVNARLRGQLTALGYQALRHFCIDGQVARYGKQDIAAYSLKFLGMEIQDLLLLKVPEGPSAPIIVHLPFDDEGQVREFADQKALESYLCQRLQEPDYCQQFLEHVAQADRPKMASALQGALYKEVDDFQLPPGLVPLQPPSPPRDGHPARETKPRDKPSLYIRERKLAEPYWPALYDEHVRCLKGNARAIAVPTADVDARARKERLEHWEETGMNLLNVAAMFVPGLDAVMFAVFAYQLLDSAFHAYEAWSEGDHAEVVAQLESLGATLGSAAVLGAVAVGAKASGFVDWMESIWLEGKQKLWDPQLGPYRSPVELPAALEADTEGVYHHDGKHYVKLDGDTFQVERDADGDWQMTHPSEPKGHRPYLRGNGKGAWRLAHERVQGWDRLKLLRRLGSISEGLGDADLLAALDSTGLERGALEAVYIEGEQTPGLLEDALLRLRKDTEADLIIDNVRHARPLAAYKNFAVPTLGELPGWPEDVLLEVFDGPEAWGSTTRYGRNLPGDLSILLSRDDLDSGRLASVVLQGLDEHSINDLLPVDTPPAQRQQALQDLLADRLDSKRAGLFDSLYKGQRTPLSPAAEVLGRQFPALPEPVLEDIVANANRAERQRLLAGRVPLRVGEEARVLQARLRLDRAILGLHRASLANADSALIRDGLLAEHPQWTTEQVFHAAQADRAKAARLIGQQPIRPGYRSPMRLADGRFGYPLSPDARLPREEQELRALYPVMDAVERRQLLATLRARGNVAAQLQGYRRELAALQASLDDWASQRPPALQRPAHRLASTLLRAWHRVDGDRLVLADLELDSLPPLTTRFDHINALHLEHLDVPAFPADYLQSFPSLTHLEVRSSGNLSMPSLFEALRHAPRLQELHIEASGLANLPAQAHDVLPLLNELHTLDLRGNGLALTEEGLSLLTERHHLRELDLSDNRIELDAGMAQRFSNLVELRSLDLSLNPLGIGPNLQNMRCLANLYLENCQLTAWPQGLEALMGSENHALRLLGLSHNQITAVPGLGTLLSTPFIEALLLPNRVEEWRFNFNPLDVPTRRQLRAAGVVVERPVEPPLLPGQAPVDWLQPDTPAQQRLWEALFADEANSALRRAVEQAGLSSAAHAAPERLARQVWRLLESAAADTELRNRLDEVAALFPVSCGDAGADVLSTLQIEVRVFELTHGQPRVNPRLFSYMRSLYRRDQVNELAQELYSARFNRRAGLLDAQAWEAMVPSERGPRPRIGRLHRFDYIPDPALLDGEGLDLIEIRLTLRINLAADLEFPETQTQMLYPDAARIIGPTEFQVMEEVQRRDGDQVARRTWVSRHPSWRRVLRGQYSASFDALRARWDAGLEYLEWCVDSDSAMEGTLQSPVVDALSATLGASPLDGQGQLQRLEIDSNQYVAGMNRVARGLEDDQDALYLELTRPLDRNN